MQVVYILCNKETLNIGLLLAVLLELGDRTVPIVDIFIGSKLDEVVMPLPDSHRICVKVDASQDLHWVRLCTINLCSTFPETIVASESWDTTCSTDSCTSHNRDLLAPY